MKKMNKKGFTIVELTIVIGVIAILAAVMVPTFSGIVGRSKESAALQKATTAYHIALGMDEDGSLINEDADPDAYIIVKRDTTEYCYKVENGKVEKAEKPADFDDYTKLTDADLGEKMDDVEFYKANEN